MKIKINGVETDIRDEATIIELLEAEGADSKGLAIAVGGKIVKRADWESTTLKPGNDVLLIKAAYGG